MGFLSCLPGPGLQSLGSLHLRLEEGSEATGCISQVAEEVGVSASWNLALAPSVPALNWLSDPVSWPLDISAAAHMGLPSAS